MAGWWSLGRYSLINASTPLSILLENISASVDREKTFHLSIFIHQIQRTIVQELKVQTRSKFLQEVTNGKKKRKKKRKKEFVYLDANT